MVGSIRDDFGSKVAYLFPGKIWDAVWPRRGVGEVLDGVLDCFLGDLEVQVVGELGGGVFVGGVLEQIGVDVFMGEGGFPMLPKFMCCFIQGHSKGSVFALKCGDLGDPSWLQLFELFGDSCSAVFVNMVREGVLLLV